MQIVRYYKQVYFDSIIEENKWLFPYLFFTRDMKKDSDGNFRFGIDLALVLSHVPKLGVAN